MKRKLSISLSDKLNRSFSSCGSFDAEIGNHSMRMITILAQRSKDVAKAELLLLSEFMRQGVLEAGNSAQYGTTEKDGQFLEMHADGQLTFSVSHDNLHGYSIYDLVNRRRTFSYPHYPQKLKFPIQLSLQVSFQYDRSIGIPNEALSQQ